VGKRKVLTIGRLLPETKTSHKSVGVIAGSATGRQLFEILDIAAAEDDVIGLQGSDQLCNHLGDVLPPFLLTSLIQTTLADVVLKGALFVGKMRQLHRFDDAVDNHGGAQAGAQSQEEHLASLVAPQGLHGGIIDNLDRTTKGGLEIESDPTG